MLLSSYLPFSPGQSPSDWQLQPSARQGSAGRSLERASASAIHTSCMTQSWPNWYIEMLSIINWIKIVSILTWNKGKTYVSNVYLVHLVRLWKNRSYFVVLELMSILRNLALNNKHQQSLPIKLSSYWICSLYLHSLIKIASKILQFFVSEIAKVIIFVGSLHLFVWGFLITILLVSILPYTGFYYVSTIVILKY